MKTTWAKLACSSIALGTLAIGCTPTANLHPNTASTSGPKATKLAAASAAKAEALLARHQAMKAIGPAEIAVAAAPDSVGYRVTLGQAYLQSGRFASAATALGEALSLDPSNARAGLNLSLAQSALGRRDESQATLAQVRSGIAAPDLGLALALAGAHGDAINLLATEARTNGVTPKIRQNLAFTLAMAGRWAESRAVAAQDLSPNDLDRRLQQWAILATPKSAADQVAGVLGIRPIADPGEPSMLALSTAPAATAVASAAPATVPAPVEATAPAVIAAAPAVAAPAPVATAAPAEVASAAPAPATPPASFYYPGQESTTFVAPAAGTPRGTPRVSARKGYPPLKSAAAEVAAPTAKPDVPKLLARRAAPPLWPKAAGGEFVVQLGAFSQPERVQAAWATASDNYLRKAAFMPSSMTFSGTSKGKLLYRLSVAGFKSRDDAQLVCSRIRSHGGKCFVRAAQGDQVAEWFKQGGTQVASRGPAPKPLAPTRQAVRIALAPAPVKRVATVMPKHAPIVIASR